MYKAHLVKIENRFKKIKAQKYPFQPESYIGNNESKYQFLNLRAPQLRDQLKMGFDFILSENAWQTWDYIYKNSMIYEVLSAAIYWASMQSLEEQWKNRKILFSWSLRADNWALSDGLCSIYAKLFEAHPKEMQKLYEKWSSSKNPWQRRMSIVGIVYYYNLRKKHPAFSYFEKMISRQFSDSHLYVQKGVGWTLRECYSLYPKKTYSYLKARAKDISPTAWQASTERLTTTKKKELLKLRKA